MSKDSKKLSLMALIMMIFTSVYGFNNMPRSFYLTRISKNSPILCRWRDELQDGEKQKRTPRTLVRAMPKQYNMVIEQLSRRQQRAVKDERT